MARVTAATCGLSDESQSTRVIIAVTCFFVGTSVFVVLRTWSKLLTRTLYAEDHIITLAVTLAMAPFVCTVYMSALGFGSHLWRLKDGALLQILRLFYISEIVYVVVLALIKVSIVTMYLRIFWAYRPFYIACYFVLTFILLSSSIITVLTILSCRPVQFFWDRDIAGGSCLDITAIAYANSGLAVLHDVTIILLPMFMLWSLQMTRKKKFFIGVMFALGGIGLVATIVRLQTLRDFGTTPDPSWEWVPVVYWTSVELAAGIIASCLPAIAEAKKTLSQRVNSSA
ncbi:CFEM domain-containing protein [Diaporthe helianthi]|uniref:CFEM domain-containing protein n=1 Tax=Diaporthe helianthi TaxID=158607 RepID=A0A2P5HSZ6_DIAHE|nr:CFEM domain-containing protein [Diaporthe helianthi]